MTTSPVVLLRDEGHRRGGHDVGDRRHLLGSGLGGRHEAGDGLGRRWQDEHAARDRVQRVELELEARDDAEVAAAAADRPEEVRVSLIVDLQDPAVGEDDLGGEQVVDRQALLADEIPDAAAGRQPADTDGAGVPEADGQAVRGRGVRDLACRQARLGPRDLLARVDLQSLHQREVEDDPSVADAVASAAVAAAADRELEAAFTCQRDDVADLACVGGLDDDRRPAVVVERHERLAGVVVARVVRGDHLSGDLGAELVDREVGACVRGQEILLWAGWLSLLDGAARRISSEASS